METLTENASINDPSTTDASQGLVLHNPINGDDRNKFIATTAKDDVVNAFGGNDYIQGSRGNDIINGGTGIDTVSSARLGSPIRLGAFGAVNLNDTNRC